MHGPFAQAFVYLLAAVLAVPVAKRLGLGSVLGYLLAGVAIGPNALKLVGDDAGNVMHFAEFGVVMMLFLVGLELKPALLWRMRGPIFGLGSLQVSCTALAVAVVLVPPGLAWKTALAVGLILALSSTAIALQTLGEKGLLKTPGGEASFAVLLFQDIAVIPILAVLPLLATGEPDRSMPTALRGGPGWAKALLVLAAVTTVIAGGRFLLPPIFRYIAATRLREMFTATALLLVIGIALLMQQVGLSAALGTFLAGVVLAESEYRHQLEADIEPFKGLLLGLFFISVGAGINFPFIADQPLLVGGCVLAMLALKGAVLLGLCLLFRLELNQSLLLTVALVGGGEFAFVLLSFSTQQGVLSPDLSRLLVAAVAISMAASPFLFTVYDKLISPRFITRLPRREPDAIDENDNPVILAGFGRFGHVVGRLLRANGLGTTVLDHDPDQVATLRKFGLKSFYGDASRLDLLHAAGAGSAKLFVLATDDDAKSLEIVQTVQKHFPHLRIFARASSRQHAYQLLRLGIDDVFRETLGSSLDLGVAALCALGVSHGRARRSARIFQKLDEAAVRAMATVSEEADEYTSLARQHIENLERVLQADRDRHGATGAPGLALDDEGPL
jgi:monovalent cation:proton antiporter-2 (CPA2) family protein